MRGREIMREPVNGRIKMKEQEVRERSTDNNTREPNQRERTNKQR